MHKTARRLGALFESELPPMEDLLRAYGTRVSEISAIPSVNPREGSDKDGIFASHIGADTTSIVRSAPDQDIIAWDGLSCIVPSPPWHLNI